MSGFEVVGAVASVVQLAATVYSISKMLYEVGDSLSNAPGDIQDLARDLETFSEELQLLSTLFDNKNSRYSDRVYKLTAKIIGDCATICIKIDRILKNLRSKNVWARVKWIYKEKEIMKLLERLKALKLCLMGMLSMLSVLKADHMMTAMGVSEPSLLEGQKDEGISDQATKDLEETRQKLTTINLGVSTQKSPRVKLIPKTKPKPEGPQELQAALNRSHEATLQEQDVTRSLDTPVPSSRATTIVEASQRQTSALISTMVLPGANSIVMNSGAMESTQSFHSAVSQFNDDPQNPIDTPWEDFKHFKHDSYVSSSANSMAPNEGQEHRLQSAEDPPRAQWQTDMIALAMRHFDMTQQDAILWASKLSAPNVGRCSGSAKTPQLCDYMPPPQSPAAATLDNPSRTMAEQQQARAQSTPFGASAYGNEKYFNLTPASSLLESNTDQPQMSNRVEQTSSTSDNITELRFAKEAGQGLFGHIPTYSHGDLSRVTNNLAGHLKKSALGNGVRLSAQAQEQGTSLSPMPENAGQSISTIWGYYDTIPSNSSATNQQTQMLRQRQQRQQQAQMPPQGQQYQWTGQAQMEMQLQSQLRAETQAHIRTPSHAQHQRPQLYAQQIALQQQRPPAHSQLLGSAKYTSFDFHLTMDFSSPSTDGLQDFDIDSFLDSEENLIDHFYRNLGTDEAVQPEFSFGISQAQQSISSNGRPQTDGLFASSFGNAAAPSGVSAGTASTISAPLASRLPYFSSFPEILSSHIRYDDGLAEKRYPISVDNEDDSPETAATPKEIQKLVHEQNRLEDEGTLRGSIELGRSFLGSSGRAQNSNLRFNNESFNMNQSVPKTKSGFEIELEYGAESGVPTVGRHHEEEGQSLRRGDEETTKYDTPKGPDGGEKPVGNLLRKKSVIHSQQLPILTQCTDGETIAGYHKADGMAPTGANPDGQGDRPFKGGSSNHGLQDYQMQFMLLEQQQKKRLMMARQEQNSMIPQVEAEDTDRAYVAAETSPSSPAYSPASEYNALGSQTIYAQAQEPLRCIGNEIGQQSQTIPPETNLTFAPASTQHSFEPSSSTGTHQDVMTPRGSGRRRLPRSDISRSEFSVAGKHAPSHEVAMQPPAEDRNAQLWWRAFQKLRDADDYLYLHGLLNDTVGSMTKLYSGDSNVAIGSALELLSLLKDAKIDSENSHADTVISSFNRLSSILQVMMETLELKVGAIIWIVICTVTKKLILNSEDLTRHQSIFAGIADTATLVARYNVMESVYQQWPGMILEPRYENSLISLCTHVLTYLAKVAKLGEDSTEYRYKIHEADAECRGFSVTVLDDILNVLAEEVVEDDDDDECGDSDSTEQPRGKKRKIEEVEDAFVNDPRLKKHVKVQ